MPASKDKPFYDMLDSIAQTTKDEDAVKQNKRIKEAEFAEDAREPNEADIEAIREELKKDHEKQGEFPHDNGIQGKKLTDSDLHSAHKHAKE